MNEKPEIYKPFDGLDGPDHRLKLRPTSKAVVREVCDVQAKRISLPDQVRCAYADQAGYERQKRENKGKTEVDFELLDVYDEYHVHAAMAQALFYDCPTMVEENEDGTVTITDPDLFDKLDEGEVNRAFLAWSAARTGTRGGQKRSLNSVPGAP